jgi:hypothetical protein
MAGSADLILGTNGVNPDKKASATECFGLDERGRYVQIRVLNATGRLTVRAISIEARRDDVMEGTIGG